jgi:imidazolonepropionase-like amidohydrolase
VPGTRFEAFHQSVLVFQAGLETSIEEAVQAATHVPAVALGLGDRLGRIEPGYVADLIVVRGRPGDPDFLLATPLLVVLEGKIIAKDGRLCRTVLDRDTVV